MPWNQNYSALNGSLLLTALPAAHSMILLGMVVVVVLLQAFVFPWILPVAPAAS